MFTVDLKSQVPQYAAAKNNWGGAACCQMAMNGYPAGATSCYINQKTVWNYIQTHNKEPGYAPTKWDYGWYADPYAITKTLNDLCPPQHSWVDVSGTDKKAVLYTLLRHMANYKYASLICTFMHDYWATLVYFKTASDPRTTTNPALNKIGYYWPTPSGAQYKEVVGATWLSTPYYWGLPCNQTNSAGESLCGQLWNNKWVGIGEPPETAGAVEVETITRVSDTIISPKEAAAAARAFVAERREEALEAQEDLARQLTGVRAAKPMLVRELPPDAEERETEQDVHYYVVPFEQKYEVDDAGARLARFSVLINAHTGRFEQLCVFPQPVRYLSERDVVRLVGGQRGQKLETELVFRTEQPHVSNALPVWQVKSDGRTFFVTQAGLIVGAALYPRLRGA